MKVVVVYPYQTIFDVCLEQIGSLEGIGGIIKDNPGILNTDELEGQKVYVRDDEIENQRIVDYFKNKQIVTY